MQLKHEFKNAWEIERENNKLNEVMDYSKGYMNFLDNGKTERTSAREIVKIAKENGYISLEEAIKKSYVKPGEKIYAVNKDKAVALFVIGKNLLEDGMKIVIPTKEEVKQWQEEEAEDENKMVLDMQNLGEDYVQYSKPKLSDEKALNNSQKVDLNTADEALLCTLPGIGTSRAKSIIDYRTQNGLFQKIEDVMKVSGIKEAAFDKIKDKITVSN